LTGDKRYYTIDYCNNLGMVYLHQRMYVHESSIITIRTPRKGCKEARDIVAKIKWKERALKHKCNTYRHGKDAICKQIYFVATQEIALVRELITAAKSMLGDHNV